MSWLARLAGARPDPEAAEKILALPCPLCAAPPGQACDPWPGNAVLARPPCGLCGDPPACQSWCDAGGGGLAMPGGNPDAALHDARILAAMAAGTVSREAVLAQFGSGEIPASLTRSDQEART